MREGELLAGVLDLAARFGWRTAHVGAPMRILPKSSGGGAIPDARARGFPDLVLVRVWTPAGDYDPRMIVAELKGDSGHPVTEDQKAWLEDLHAVANLTEIRGVDAARLSVHLWTPADWPDAIAEALRADV